MRKANLSSTIKKKLNYVDVNWTVGVIANG